MRLMKCIILKRILKCITNNCKPLRNFDFLEAELSFRFVWFEKFPCVIFYFRWEDGTYCLSSVLFGHKNMKTSSLEYFYKKPYRTWPTAVKTFKNHQHASTRTHKTIQILLRRFLDEYT